MRQVIVSEFVTLDGVMEAPGGEPSHPHSGWTIPFGTPELYEYKLGEVREASALLLGRKTYEGFAAAWPSVEGAFGDLMNALPKYVATSTLRGLEWNATRLEGDAPAAVAALRASEGGPILVNGSATLVRSLLAHGLVDELRLAVFPIAIGGGLRIFPEGRRRIDLELVELVRYETGVLLQVYRPAAPVAPDAGEAAIAAILERC